MEARKLSTMKSSLSPMRQAASFKVGKTNKIKNKQTNSLLSTVYKELRKEREPDEVWLSSEDVEYTSSTLKPGQVSNYKCKVVS